MKNKKENMKYYTYGLDMVFLNILSIVLFGGVWIMVMFITRNRSDFFSGDVGFLFIYMVLWLMLHEVIHAIGFGIFPQVKKSNICFGMALEKGVFYCMCKQKISKRVILTSLMLPFTVIGVITLIIGLYINSYDLVMLSVLNIAGAVGDLVMTCYFLKVPNDVIYLDLDDCTSFTVLSNSDLDNISVKGIKLKESGVYDSSKMVSKDKRRLVISKTSYIVLGIIVILTLFMIFVRR